MTPRSIITTRFSICHLVLAAMAFLISPDRAYSAANLMQNGDFESPQISVDSYGHIDPSPWVRIVDINGGVHPILNGSPPDSNSPGPQSGNQYFALGHAQGGIYQNFTLNEGGVFQLDWWISSTFEITGTAYLPYSIRVLDFADAVITTRSFDAYSADDKWRQESFQFSAAEGEYKLEFVSPNEEYDWDIYLDSVQLAAVPEPATYSFLTLGALLLMRRRKSV